MKNIKDVAGSVYVNSSADMATGAARTSIQVPGKFYVSVMNDSQDTQVYHYTFVVCSETGNGYTGCDQYDDVIQLEPGGGVANFQDAKLYVNYNAPGQYKTRVVSALWSEADGSNAATAMSSSVVNVTE